MMVNGVINVLKAAAEEVGFRVFDDYDKVDTLLYPDDELAFFSVRDIKVMPWVKALYLSVYGAQVEGHARLRLMGKRCGYGDHDDLEEKVSALINKVGFCSGIVITSINREDVSENRRVGRLECELTADFKLFITEEALQGGE